MLLFKKLNSEAKLPIRMTENAAGYDLFALNETVAIHPYKCVRVDTGIAVEFPKGYYGTVQGRSSLSLQHLYCHSGTSKLIYY